MKHRTKTKTLLGCFVRNTIEWARGDRAARRFVEENPGSCRRALRWYDEAQATDFLSLVAGGTGYGYIPSAAMRRALKEREATP